MSCSSPWRVCPCRSSGKALSPCTYDECMRIQAEWSALIMLCTTCDLQQADSPVKLPTGSTWPTAKLWPMPTWEHTIPAELSWNHGPLNNQRPDVPRTARWEMEQIYSRRFFWMPGVCHVVSSAFCIADYVVMTLVLLPTDILEQNSERNSQCCTTGTQNIPPGYEGGREVWAMSSPEANVARVWLSCGCTAVVFASCFGAL